MSIYSIYKIVNRVNGKVYIGYTKNFTKRMYHHKRDALTKENTLYRAVRKYGWDNFSVEIIYQSTNGEHTNNIMEPYFISEYNSSVQNNGYNETSGGKGCQNLSEESLEKMRKAKLGKKLSAEHKKKLLKANFGKHRSEETKEKLRKKKLTKEHIELLVNHSVKSFVVTNINGEVYIITNMAKFCRDNNLSASKMCSVSKGNRTHHKGWKVQELNKTHL